MWNLRNNTDFQEFLKPFIEAKAKDPTMEVNGLDSSFVFARAQAYAACAKAILHFIESNAKAFPTTTFGESSPE